LSSHETFSGHGWRVAGAGGGRPGASAPDDLLEDYVRRTVAGDWNALEALYTALSPYVRDSAACLFGHGGKADAVTDAVFVDVWQYAYQYRPGGDGVHAWVLTIAGQHTMSRYESNMGTRAGIRM
jgi:DNA-directed RNA polymerase specialized sigma24 family protein